MKRWIAGVVIVCSLFISGAGYWLLATSAGLRFTLQVVVDAIDLPLSYTNLQGTVLSTIRADSAQYKDETVTVNVKQFATRFSLTPLLLGRVAFSDVTSTEIEVLLTDESENAQADTDQNISQRAGSMEVGLPIVISLENARFKTVHVKDQKNTLVIVSDIALVDGEVRDHFSFTRLSFGIDPATFTTTGHIGFAELAEVKLDANWKTIAFENVPAMSGTLSTKGTYQQLLIDAQIKSPETIGISVGIDNLFSKLAWNAEIHGDKLSLSVFDAGISSEIQQFLFNVTGDVSSVAITGKCELWDAQLGKWSAFINSRFDESKIELNELKLQSLESPAMMTVNGHTLENFSYEDWGPFQVSTSWEKIQWPITGAPLVSSEAGQAEARGSISDYQVRVIDTELSVEEHKLTRFNASGSGNLNALNITEFTTSYLAGSWSGDGRVDWQNDFQWNVALKAKGVDTSRQWPEWSAKLNGKAVVKGIHKKGDWKITGEVEKIDGEAAGLPVDHVSLKFDLAENVYAVKNLKFVSQQNKLRGAVRLKTISRENPVITA
ncbi:hypothetical protein, partial [Kaarinaea lacus]